MSRLVARAAPSRARPAEQLLLARAQVPTVRTAPTSCVPASRRPRARGTLWASPARVPPPEAFDEVCVGVYLVGAVYGEIRACLGGERDERDAHVLGQRRRVLRGGYPRTSRNSPLASSSPVRRITQDDVVLDRGREPSRCLRNAPPPRRRPRASAHLSLLRTRSSASRSLRPVSLSCRGPSPPAGSAGPSSRGCRRWRGRSRGCGTTSCSPAPRTRGPAPSRCC